MNKIIKDYGEYILFAMCLAFAFLSNTQGMDFLGVMLAFISIIALVFVVIIIVNKYE